MKHTLRSSKHLIRFLENKPMERKIKPAQPLLPAQAGKAAAQQKSEPASVPTRTSARPGRSRSLHRAGVLLGLTFRGCTKETSEMFAGLDKEQQAGKRASQTQSCSRKKQSSSKLVKRTRPRWGSHSTSEPLQHRQWLNGAWVPRKKECIFNGELEVWEITIAQHHCSEFPTRCFRQCEISISSLLSLNTEYSWDTISV